MERSEAWRALRALRAAPPGNAASSDARRELFTAALEQGQQFMHAAETAGYATRPVQLFYGLSQLGRSVAAASRLLADSPGGPQQLGSEYGHRQLVETWRLSGHGIKTPRIRERSRSGLSAVMVKGESLGAAPGVARAMGSAPLPTDEIPLMDLWAMLPEARQAPSEEFTGKPPILSVSHEHEQAWYDAANIPDGPPITHVTLHAVPADLHGASLSDYLTWFPGLGEPRPPDELTARKDVKITWVANQEDVNKDWANWYSHGIVPKLPCVAYRGAECAVPVIAGMREPVHPITIWWSVLFTLSMLARYEPDTWSAFIDVDRSAHASAIEHVLDVALDAVPELVLEAINGIDAAA